ncbi:MAG: peptide ABC transporter substrate-binding protein [Treponema sp.]|nr:peptide ABC transporter substrate-binding protein [Treponema sp.]
MINKIKVKYPVITGLIVCCLLFTGFIGGCSSTPAENPQGEAPGITEAPAPDENLPEIQSPGDLPDYAQTRPRAQTRDELTVVFSKDDVELDFRKSFLASEAQIYTGIYEGLFSYHPLTMEPVPAVASSWVTSEDKKQWTFTIRTGAKYSNGDPVRAQDFRASWLSILEAGDSAPYSSLFDIIEGARDYRLGITKDPSTVGISTPDDKTLVVRLNSPAAYFPSMLCHHSFGPIHPSMLNNTDWTKSLPICNGPFYVSEYSADRMVLTKNPNYWDAARTSLNKITIQFAETGDDAAALWNSGTAHWISGDVNLDALTDRSGITVNAMFATFYYYIRCQKPWDDYRIRQALTLVLPWDQIRNGYYLPADTLIYPIPGYPQIEGLNKNDTDQALKLLEQAGYPRGIGLPPLVIRVTPSQDAARISSLMAQAWTEKLGIQVKIDVVPFNQYIQSLKNSDYTVGALTWIGDFADPYTFLQMWRRDSNLNDAMFSDDDYEALMDRSMTEDGATRWQTLSEAEELLLSRGAVLPISFNPALNVIDTDEISGWYPNVLDIHPFKYLSFRNFRPLPGVAMASFSVVN